MVSFAFLLASGINVYVWVIFAEELSVVFTYRYAKRDFTLIPTEWGHYSYHTKQNSILSVFSYHTNRDLVLIISKGAYRYIKKGLILIKSTLLLPSHTVKYTYIRMYIYLAQLVVKATSDVCYPFLIIIMMS